jgi:membrane protease YdiL (CAAX protease family)
LDIISIIWLVLLLGAGASALWLKDRQKKIATAALLVLMTVYVGSKFYQSIYVEKRIGKAGPSIDVDRAELMLRMGSAIESFRSNARDSLKSVPGVPGAAAVVNQAQGPDIYSEPEHVLKSAAEASPDQPAAWAKLALVQHTAKSEYSSSLEHLSKINTPESLALEKAMRGVLKGPLSSSQLKETKEVIEKELPAGWYRSHALEALYRRTGERGNLERLIQEAGVSDALLFGKLLFLGVFGVIAFLVGLAVIFVQLLFVARSAGKSPEDELVMAPVYSKALTIYGVFIGWLTVQSMIGSIAQSGLKSLSPILKLSAVMEPGSNKPVLIALIVGLLYILTNGPGTLLAYLVTMKPHKIAFFEGFRLRTKVPGKAGPLRLIFAGIATWFAAVPLVLIASIIGMKLGSQGSSNPIIALIMEAARSGNILSTVVFYLTLSVLAPFCEETLFRGFLYANLRRSMGVFPAMCLSAFLFAAFHLDVGAFLPLFTLGCLFALTFEKNKSILPSMIAHGLWNGGTFTLLLLLFA